MLKGIVDEYSQETLLKRIDQAKANGFSFPETLEEWVEPRQSWTLLLREGYEFGRPNNVEATLAFVAGEQTSTLQFRLEQLDSATDTGEQLVLQFEERDGIARLARLMSNGLSVELHHILTFT